MNIEELIASRLEDLGEEDKRLLADLADFLAARRKGQSVDGKTLKSVLNNSLCQFQVDLDLYHQQ